MTPTRHPPFGAALALAASLASAASAATLEPGEWCFGLRPQARRVTRVVKVRAPAGQECRIERVQPSAPWLEARVLEQAVSPGKPGEVEVSVLTGSQAGRVESSVFLSLTDTDHPALRLPVNGWVLPEEQLGEVEVFYVPGSAQADELLKWWEGVASRGRDPGRVRLLSVGEVENYRKLRELERTVAEPPKADVVAYARSLAIGGVRDIRLALTGLLELEPDVRSERAEGSDAESREIALPEFRGKLEVWFFYFSLCDGCEDAEEAVRALPKSLGVDLHVFDAAREPESLAVAFATLEVYPDAPGTVPSAVAFVGDQALYGTREVVSYVEKLAEKQAARGGEHLRVRRPSVVMPLADRARSLGVWPVILAGLADGVNPCAFAAMVLLISILSVGAAAGPEGIDRRVPLLLGGGSFLLGIFVTYYLAGFALFVGLRELRAFPIVEGIIFWSVLSLAVVAGVLSLADAVVYWRTRDPKRMKLKVPDALRRRFGRIMQSRFSKLGLVAGGFTGGVVIALLEGVCTGQMYLPTIQYMTGEPGLRLRGASYLLLYNALFILPLAAILALALAGVHFRRLTGLLERHMAAAKLGLGMAFAALAAAMVVAH